MPVSSLRATLAVAAVVALTVNLTGCAESKRDSGGAAKKDTFVLGTEADPKVLDPAFASDGPSLKVARQIYETLLRPEDGGTKLIPDLAASMPTPDAAGTTWTFKLRQGVKFHDGTPFNAAAVCFNFNRWYNFTGLLQSPDVSAYWQDIFGGFAKNEDAELPPSLFKSCTVKDDATVDIAVTRVTSKFPAALALPSFGIASPAALQKYNADKIGGTADNITYPEYATSHPTGTGRYKFVKWDTANKTVELVRNEDYPGDKAKIKTLIFKTIPDVNARKQALRSKDVQGYDLVAPADVPVLKGEGFNVLPRPPFNVLYLAINQNGPAKAALRKPEVRQAIAHAINRDAIVASKYPEGSSVAINFMPPTLDGFNPNVTKYEYNTAKAKELLAKAGVPKLKVKFHYPTEVTRAYMPAPREIHELIKGDLEAAGIQIEPIALKWSPDYLNATTTGTDHDLHLLGWNGDYSHPHNFIGTFFDRPKDEWGFTNQPLFDLFAKADSEPDQTKAMGLYQELNKMLLDFLPGIPIAHGPSAIVFGKEISGLKASPLTDEQFWQAEYK